jgi:DNA topoisomerase I
MKLLIVESPAKAKTITKYLDNKYKVVASVGHIRDLPKSNKKAIDIDGGFIPHYEVKGDKKKVVSELRDLSSKAEEVVLATDPDREGESIAWHIAEALKLKKPKRVAFNEITEEAVREAIEHPRDIDIDLKEAQEARRVLDRLFGYDLSGLIWKKVRYGLSAGRVQSPALRIIMEKEREIRAFKSEDFWVITAKTKTKKGEELIVVCLEEPRDEELVKKILESGKNGKWSVKSVEEKEMKRSPSAPFKTSTLQQRASSLLGMSPSRTMRAAQKLYEKGHITYMRTDSTNLSASAHKQLLAVVNDKYGKEYVQPRTYKTTSKNAQEAHEAIRPTNAGVVSVGSDSDEKTLYELIWRRTVASQMTDARLLKTKITTKIDDGSVPEFSANGSRTIFPGWLKASPESGGEDVELPEVKNGELLELLNIESEKKETKPPSRYTEAGLIKELEKRGIGRPSTYAAIMRTLSDRGYVNKEGKTLFPTDTGDVVSSFLEENFEKYISDSFTAEMEDELDDIAEGKRAYKKTLNDFYKEFSKDVSKKENMDKITDLGEAPVEFSCPKCGKKMIIKLGRSGKFMSCSDFPNCHGMRSIEGKEIKESEPIGVDPESGLNVYVLEGPYGPYVQLGEKDPKNNPPSPKGYGRTRKKPKRGKIPNDISPEDITLEEALKYVALPRELGKHPETGEMISASIGRFGPFIVHQKDFRSLKEDDVYTIELPRALEILAEEKKVRRGRKKTQVK